jgi:hypothetical protein
MGRKVKSVLPTEPYESWGAFDQNLARATFTSFDILPENVHVVLDGLSLANRYLLDVDYSMGHHGDGAFIAIRLPVSIDKITKIISENMECDRLHDDASDEEYQEALTRDRDRLDLLQLAQFSNLDDPILLAIAGYKIGARRTDDENLQEKYLGIAELLESKRDEMIKYSREKRMNRIFGVRPKLIEIIRARISQLGLTDTEEADSIES